MQRYFLMGIFVFVLSACSVQVGKDSTESAGEQDTGASRFEALRNHGSFSALIQEVHCDSRRKEARAIVFQAHVRRKVNGAPSTPEHIRLLADPKTQMIKITMKATSRDFWGNYFFGKMTNKYSISKDELEIEDFGKIRVNGSGLLLEVTDGESSVGLDRSRAELNTIDDGLDYGAFCRE